jgi:IS5 family transposase
MLMEQLDYNLLFRWFVGLNMEDAVWDATVFTKNRQRLQAGDIAHAFFERGAQAGTPARAAIARALYREWNSAGSMGGTKELLSAR